MNVYIYAANKIKLFFFSLLLLTKHLMMGEVIRKRNIKKSRSNLHCYPGQKIRHVYGEITTKNTITRNNRPGLYRDKEKLI